MPIICTPYPAIASGWSENTTTTWNSTQSYYKSSQVLDEQVVYYGNGNVSGDSQRYAFDITEEVKNWATGYSTPDRGVVFRMSDSFEAQTPSTTQDELKYFGSYNRSDYKPSFSLRYRTKEIYTLSVTNSSNELYMYKIDSDINFMTENSIVSSVSMEFMSIVGLPPTEDKTARISVENTGKSMWCIKYSQYYDAYQLISMGTRLNNGQRQACVYSSSSGVGLGDDYMYTTSTMFIADWAGGTQYTFKSYTTGNYLCVGSNNKLTQTSNVAEATKFTVNNLPLESFNNFWSGTYNSGIYNGVAHIKIVLDSSITNSDLYGSNDFSAVKQWNGITDNVVIYGPNDEPPTGITPFYVTFKASTSLEEMTGATVPNGFDYSYWNNLAADETDSILNSDWNSVTVYLDDRETSYSTNDTALLNIYINKTIAHEMGHVLKLAHPDQDTYLHLYSGSRGSYISVFSVYSIMNTASPADTNSSRPLTAAKPQMHDMINLENKWERHNGCSH